MASLDQMFQDRLRRARETIGTAQEIALPGGAGFTVRVDPITDQPGRVRVAAVFWRAEKQLSATELTTFRDKCKIPHTAQRWPSTGQHKKAGRYLVAYSWPEAAPAAAARPRQAEEEPPPPEAAPELMPTTLW